MGKGILKSVSLAAALMLLAGCSAGPRYTTPSAPLPTAYKELASSAGGWKLAEPGDELSRGAWWERFNDGQLNELERRVDISNQNIAAAAANVQVARALIREARAQYLPQLTVNPAITNSRLSTAFGQSVGLNFSTFVLPFDASWEPDLWGRIRTTVKANTFAAQASIADLEDVRLAAQADLAADYYELRAQESLKRLLDAVVAADQEALDLTVDLCAAGMDADEAVAQAEAQLKAAQAQDTTAAILRAQYEHAIAVLAGQPPSEFSIPDEIVRQSLPSIPAGIPSKLLERRPDIAAAERAVAQANAQIGIASKAYFPNVTLSAAAGLQSLSMANWLTWPARMWSLGPNLAQTVFDGGARKATVQQYQAAYDATVANYRQTVLAAFEQVEDNLSAVRILHQAIEQQDSAIASSVRNLEDAGVRYRAGLDPYFNVIAARKALLSGQQAAVSFRTQQMVAGVQLIKAWGGGWDASRIPSANELGVKTSVDRQPER
jgi:NodT family efflux transporter outer membrane factor (OMF) lipoprotein